MIRRTSTRNTLGFYRVLSRKTGLIVPVVQLACGDGLVLFLHRPILDWVQFLTSVLEAIRLTVSGSGVTKNAIDCLALVRPCSAGKMTRWIVA